MKHSTCHRLAAFLMLLVVSLVGAGEAQAQLKHNEKSFGPKIGYVSRNHTAYGALVFRYSFSSTVRIAPEAGIIFRNHGMDGLSVNANLEFPISCGSGWVVYPFTGPAFTSWGLHGIGEMNDDDVTTHSNQWGINVGAGVETYIKPSLKLSIEGRYTLMRHYPTAFVTAGIAFVF